MKNNECFYCLNHGEGKPADNTGWYHPCKLGIENEGLREIEKCEKWKPNKGFQIGGYYSHMHFEFDENNSNECMEWVIHSDGEFPRDNPNEMIKFHICDFRQIEEWVKFWGKYLRERGAIVDEEGT